MAEGPPAPSLEELAKPKSSQKEKRPHQTEGKEVERPALQLSEAQQEPPAAALQTRVKIRSSSYLDTVSAEASELSLSDPQQKSDQPLSHPSSRSSSPPTLIKVLCSVKYRSKPSSELPALQLSEVQQEPPAAALQTASSEDKEQYLDTVSAEASELSPTLSSTAILLEKPLPRTDPPSLEEPAKPKSSQKEKRPH